MRKHSIPIARVVPVNPMVNPNRKNRTVLGSGKGSVCIKRDLIESVLSRSGRFDYRGYNADLFV